MNALDTNILIRFLTQDDVKQANLVLSLFSKAEKTNEQFYVSIVVVMEMIWVLESVYIIPRNELLDVLATLLLMPVLKFEHNATIRDFINSAYDNQYDLSDILIAQCANKNSCTTTLTFDKKAAKFDFFQLLK